MRKIDVNTYEIGNNDVKGLLMKRDKDSNKGDFGKAGIYGGSIEYSGALKLSYLSLTALRSGCGISRVLVKEEVLPLLGPNILEQTLCILPSYSDDFYNRLKGKISHETFIENKKLFYISCEGSKADNKGNRKFKFDINTLNGSVKLNNKVVSFSCIKQNKTNMNILRQAIMLAENGEIGLTYRLNGEYFYICVDLEKLTFDRYNVCKNTTLAIDMNPNYIGLCIINPNDKIIHKQVYDLSKIKNNNKRDYELTQIAISIAKLCKHYRVEMVGYEKLKIYSSNKGKGRRFNKQVNNDWHRCIFVNSLHKWLGIINCKWVEIIPEYSSYIGCIMYENETDSIAASIELNRRLREYKSIYIDKTKSKGNIVYPLFTMSHFNRWKESLDGRVFKDWKESYQWFKETKHSYRLTYPLWLKHNGIRPFRYKSFKSMINHVII